jgi:hypothetical protein
MKYQGYDRLLSTLTKKDYIEIKENTKRGEYKKALELLAAKNGEELTPQDVVEEAKSETSPLHRIFEWDDKRAGDRYRLMQARLLINSVRVTIEGKEKPAFFNVQVTLEDKKVRKYFPIEQVLNNEKLHSAVLRSAIREIRHAQEKYKMVSELNGIINEEKLKEIESELEK